jgi:hypothetical protein
MIFLFRLPTPYLQIMHSPVSEQSVATSRRKTKVTDKTNKADPPVTKSSDLAADALLFRLELLEKGVKYWFWGVAGMSLIAYGCVVYTQEQWKVHHRQLRKLQTQESQQAIINASLKNTQAQNAEKNKSGLVAPQPDKVLFVPATTQPESVPANIAVEQPTVLPGPVGY